MSGEIAITINTNRAQYASLPTPQQAYLLIEAMPTELAPAAQAAINFCLVLDRSGSMAGEKLVNLKTAASLIVDRLNPNDTLSIVIFDERADIIIPCQPVADREDIKHRIAGIQERGGTRMSVGMQAGLNELQKGASADRVSRMLLLTDGQTWEDQPQCQAIAEQARQYGFPLHVMGMGVGDESNWDPAFLEKLAQQSGGEWYVIDTPDKATAIFEKTLTSMQGIAVTNAQLTLRLASNVLVKKAWRVVPLISPLDPRSISDTDVQVFFGDIEHSKGQSMLLEVLLPVRPAGVYRMFQVDITYDVPANHLTGQRVSSDVIVTVTDDAAAANQLNPHVMNILERVVAHKLQTQALDELAAGQVANATQRLKATATRLIELGQDELAQNVLSQANQLEQQGKVDTAATQRLRYETKRLTENLPDEVTPPPTP
jgi:Ca-activated chloride channel family protein